MGLVTRPSSVTKMTALSLTHSNIHIYILCVCSSLDSQPLLLLQQTTKGKLRQCSLYLLIQIRGPCVNERLLLSSTCSRRHKMAETAEPKNLGEYSKRDKENQAACELAIAHGSARATKGMK